MKTAALAILAAAPAVSAFAVGPGPNAAVPTRRVAPLHLVPSQGPQLAAASCASLAKKAGDSSEDAGAAVLSRDAPSAPIDQPLVEVSGLPGETPLSVAISTGAARDFVSRIFSLPAALRSRAASALDSESDDDGAPVGECESDDEVVMYPVVGFRWVEPKDGTAMRVLPPPVSESGGCSIQAPDQQVYGWFSKACKLGSPFGSDEDYIHPN